MKKVKVVLTREPIWNVYAIKAIQGSVMVSMLGKDYRVGDTLPEKDAVTLSTIYQITTR